VLVETPAVTLGVDGLVAAVAPELVLRLVQDRGAGRTRTFAVSVHVAHVDREVQAGVATSLGREGPVAAGPTEHDAAAAELHLRVHAAGVLEARLLALPEAEGALQEVDGGQDVLVGKLGNDLGDARRRTADRKFLACGGSHELAPLAFQEPGRDLCVATQPADPIQLIRHGRHCSELDGWVSCHLLSRSA
jgi:hypothetical protein